MDAPIKRLLTTKEAAEVLNLSEQTLRNWRSTGLVKVPYVELGSAVRYRVSDLEKYIERNTVGSK